MRKEYRFGFNGIIEYPIQILYHQNHIQITKSSSHALALFRLLSSFRWIFSLYFIPFGMQWKIDDTQTHVYIQYIMVDIFNAAWTVAYRLLAVYLPCNLKSRKTQLSNYLCNALTSSRTLTALSSTLATNKLNIIRFNFRWQAIFGCCSAFLLWFWQK